MSTLYVVPVPIGNLGDITLRALEILKSIPLILCEDTRVTRKLFTLLNIPTDNKQFISYFEHNERGKIPFVLDLLKSGKDLALVSDSGTPLISDPGFPLVREIRRLLESGSPIELEMGSTNSDPQRALKLEVLPGPTAFVPALIQSGYPTDQFLFLGFIPRKPGDRKKMYQSVLRISKHANLTYIAYESPMRIEASLRIMREVLGKKVSVCICRELTKLHESVDSKSIDNIIKLVSMDNFDKRGELVIVFRLNHDNK